MTIINAAMEAVMDLIDGLGLFALITRGALGTGEGLVCEVGPSGPDEVYMDKNQYIIVDFTINGKHSNLQTLSEAVNGIHEYLTMLREYPSGENWKIVDITTMTEPQIIERDEESKWVMASALNVKVYTNIE
jgi:hypothetical protein